jgi:hypothetical protein
LYLPRPIGPKPSSVALRLAFLKHRDRGIVDTEVLVDEFRNRRPRAPDGNLNSNERLTVTIVGIIVVIILVLLAIYLFQRVR